MRFSIETLKAGHFIDGPYGGLTSGPLQWRSVATSINKLVDLGDTKPFTRRCVYAAIQSIASASRPRSQLAQKLFR